MCDISERDFSQFFKPLSPKIDVLSKHISITVSIVSSSFNTRNRIRNRTSNKNTVEVNFTIMFRYLHLRSSIVKKFFTFLNDSYFNNLSIHFYQVRINYDFIKRLTKESPTNCTLSCLDYSATLYMRESRLSRKHAPLNPTRSRISATISSLAENMCVERGVTRINYHRRWYYWIPLVEYITNGSTSARLYGADR